MYISMFYAHTMGMPIGCTAYWNWSYAAKRLLGWMRRVALVGVMLCLCGPTAAQVETNDSIAFNDTKFRLTQLIAPTTLIVAGSIGAGSDLFHSFRKDMKDELYEFRGDNKFRIDDILQYVPTAANLGLEYVGVKPRHELRERAAATATACAIMAAAVNITKHTAREKRPDSDERNSFPSGHTATAFMGAELVREEYGTVCGIGAYTLATGIAALRLYNDRHWLNDIVAGAGIGILSARVGYWLLPWERRLLGWDKTARPMAVTPFYEPTGNGLGLALSVGF